MASSIYLASSPYENRYLCLSCYQTQDIATNKSKIDWVLESKGGNVNYYSTGPTTVTIAGQQVYHKGRTNWNTKEFPAAKGSVSGTIYVEHDSVGDKSIDVSFTTAIYVGATSTYSGTWHLDNIPRGAKVTDVPSSFLSNGEPPTINYTNPAGGNATSVQICIADSNAYNIYAPYRDLDKGGESYKFTQSDMETLKSIAGNTLELTFVIMTDINGTKFWHNLPSIFTMVEDETTKPTLTMSASLNNGSLPSQFNGLYIQGKSKIDVELSAQGKYNATISSYSTTLDGRTYTSDKFTTEAIQSEGNISLNSSVKDSRSFTDSKIKTINVIPYSKPLVIPIGSENAILCYRSDGNGKRVGNSTSVWIKAQRNYKTVTSNAVQKNFCKLQWRRKLVSESWDDNNSNHKWKDLIPKTNTTTAEYNAMLPNEVFELTKSYTVQIMAIDDIGEKDVKTFEIPTQDVALHLGKGGKNVSVGTYCDYSKDYTFYSEWDAYFDKDVYVGGSQMVDFVIARGTNGIWAYEKWASGKAKCWGVTNAEVFSIDTQYSSVYYSEPTSNGKIGNARFPENLFCEAPTNIHIQNYATAGLIGCHIRDVSKEEVNFFVSNPIRVDLTLQFTIEAQGRWK